MRHGETEWSLSGAHTGRTDVPLTDRGRTMALRAGEYLASHEFALVLTSPLSRAAETCRLAGYGDLALREPNLAEWDYGVYEGRTSDEIRHEEPTWSVWSATITRGESLADVGRRAESVLSAALEAPGDVLMFAHGHIIRVIAAAWIGCPYDAGRFLALDTAALSVLGYERETRVVRMWNRKLWE